MKRTTLASAMALMALALCVRAASVSDLVGSMDCYQVHRNGRTIRVLDCKTGVSRNVCDAPGDPEWFGGLNQDASKVVFTANGKVWVVNWDGSNMQVVAGGDNGHPWGTDWVVYTGERENKSGAGTTWKVQFDKGSNRPIESTRKRIAEGQYSGGMTGNGQYLAESYGKSYMLRISDGKKSPYFNSEQNCSPSPHPGNKCQMMFNRDPGHRAMVIGEWDPNSNTTRIVWTFDGTEIFGLWSTNHENFCVMENPNRIVRISDKQTATINIGGYLGGPWVGDRKDGPLPPPRVADPQISPAGGSFTSPAVRVTISTSTSGADIRYTTNGQNPSPSSTPYTAAFDLALPAAGPLTIKVQAFKAGQEPSNVVTATFTRVAAREPDQVSGTLVNGVDYAYYEGAWSALPAFGSLTPASTGTADNFDLGVRKRNDNFAIRYETYLDVPAEGAYTFYTNSDDGSVLYVGDTRVVDNDGAHATQERSGAVPLKAGKHKVVVAFLEIGGEEVLTVSYQGPGISKRPVPSSSLFRLAPPVVLIAPNGGETFAAGQDMTVRWQTNDRNAFNDCVVSLSLNSGRDWILLTTQGSVGIDDAGWGAFVYRLPASVDGTPTASTTCRVRVAQYNKEGELSDMSDADFTIQGLPTASPQGPAGSHQLTARAMSLRDRTGGRPLYDIRGRSVHGGASLGLGVGLVRRTHGSVPSRVVQGLASH